MFDFHRFLRRKNRAGVVEQLRDRLEAFRDLLEKNNRVLELIGDAGEKLGGDYLFDSQYLRSLDAQLAEAVEAVVGDLHRITPGRYRDLDDVFVKVHDAVRVHLESRAITCSGPLCLPLVKVGTEQARLVGEKMARLGEVRARLALPVPPGFVITACAFHEIMNESGAAAILERGTEAGQDQLELAEQVHRTLSSSGVSSTVKKAIKQATSRFPRRTRFAVRSSALGEDGSLSFAGIFDSFLNVGRRSLPDAAVQVVASLFAERAQRYRMDHDEPLLPSAMAVGCMVMVPVVSSGVLYTLDPSDPDHDAILVNGTWGVGSIVVEGSAPCDSFTLSRTTPAAVLERKIESKETMHVAAAEGKGIEVVPVPAERRGEPCVRDDTLAELARIAMRIERHMRCPLDLEWAVDEEDKIWVLQARPLRVSATEGVRSHALQDVLSTHPVVFRDQGVVACRGIGAGSVVLVSPGADINDIPPGGVLVAPYPSPGFSGLVPRASALITDAGSSTGHLATVAREARVPTIVNTGVATSQLRPGMAVTVDAEENIIYEGIVPELLRYGLRKEKPFEDAREFRVLRAMLEHIAPLHLLDPSSSSFTPRECTSYHDIIRFAHEKALVALSNLDGLDFGRKREHLRPLSLDIPLDLRLIDVGGGIDPDVEPGEVPLSKVTCRPLRPLIEALISPGVWTTSPADMDLAGFMASVTRAGALTIPGGGKIERNVAIISGRYLNLSLRLGYHANVIDSYLGRGDEDSYVLFRFVGGVTEMARRARRASLLCEILSHFDFAVERSGDLVVARLSGASSAIIEDRLTMLGRLIGFSRQLDIQLRDEASARRQADLFLSGADVQSSTATRGEERMSRTTRVMVLDDEPTVGERLKDYLEKSDMVVETFVDSQTAIERLEHQRFDVVVTDLKMEGPTGLDVLVHIRDQKLPTEVIIITGYASIEDAHGASAVGAYDFISKPFRMTDIKRLVKKAARKARRAG